LRPTGLIVDANGHSELRNTVRRQVYYMEDLELGILVGRQINGLPQRSVRSGGAIHLDENALVHGYSALFGPHQEVRAAVLAPRVVSDRRCAMKALL
jgi:hypothetical protein